MKIRFQVGLNPREIEVLCLIARGYSNKKISNILCVSPYTVKDHTKHIFKKVKVNNRTLAAVWAVQHNLV